MHVIQKTVKARMQKKVYMNAFLKLNNICSLQYDSIFFFYSMILKVFKKLLPNQLISFKLIYKEYSIGYIS